jgi:hypothetical protein
MKDGLIVGYNNVYENEICKKTKKRVGSGIYCTPNIKIAKGYTLSFEYNGGKHRLALQCRVKPEAVRYTSNPDYWVINNPSDIRPYGILLYCEEPTKCKCGHRTA